MLPLQRFPISGTSPEAEGKDLTDETLRQAKKPGRNENLRMKNQKAQRILKGNERYLNGNEFGENSKSNMFLQRFTKWVVAEKNIFRSLRELDNFFVCAVLSASALYMGPFGRVHILVLSDLKIWRPSNKIFETLESRPMGFKRHSLLEIYQIRTRILTLRTDKRSAF